MYITVKTLLIHQLTSSYLQKSKKSNFLTGSFVQGRIQTGAIGATAPVRIEKT